MVVVVLVVVAAVVVVVVEVVVVVAVAAAGIVVVVVVVVVEVVVVVVVVEGFGPVTGPPSFPGANFQQMVIARLSLGLSFLGLRNFLKLCHDEKPCTWWLGEKGVGSLQSRLARMLHHEYDALKGYRFLGGAISFYSVSCMSDVIFNPSLLNWSSLILTVAHIWHHKIHTDASIEVWHSVTRYDKYKLQEPGVPPLPLGGW